MLPSSQFGSSQNKLKKNVKELFVQDDGAWVFTTDGQCFRFDPQTGQSTKSNKTARQRSSSKWELRHIGEESQLVSTQNKQVWKLGALGRGTPDPCWSSDGSLLLTCSLKKSKERSHGFSLWNAKTKTETLFVPFAQSSTRASITKATLATDGRWVALAHKQLGIIVWTKTHQWLTAYELDATEVFELFARGDELWILCSDRSLLRWKLEDKPEDAPSLVNKLSDNFSHATFAPDGSYLLCAHEQKVWSVSLPSGKEVLFDEGAEGAIVSLALDQTGRQLAVASNSRTVRVYDTKTKDTRALLETSAEKTAMHHLAFSSDGTQLYAAGKQGIDAVTWRWNVSDGNVEHLHNRPNCLVRRLRTSPSATHICLEYNHNSGSFRACLLDVTTSPCRELELGKTATLAATVFSEDSQELLAVTIDTQLRLVRWKLPTQANGSAQMQSVPLQGSLFLVSEWVTFSSDGKLFASEGRGTRSNDLLITELQSNEVRSIKNACRDTEVASPACRAVFGKRLYAQRIKRHTAHCWDTTLCTTHCTLELPEKEDTITTLALSSDERQLYAGTARGVVYCFDLPALAWEEQP